MGAPLGTVTEVLVNAIVTRLDASPTLGRDGIAVYNHGPNPVGIFVTTAASPTFTLDTATRLDPEDTWGPYPLGPEVHVFGITTVLQTTGAATLVTQFGG
jgi:hypothetical protein